MVLPCGNLSNTNTYWQHLFAREPLKNVRESNGDKILQLFILSSFYVLFCNSLISKLPLQIRIQGTNDHLPDPDLNLGFNFLTFGAIYFTEKNLNIAVVRKGKRKHLYEKPTLLSCRILCREFCRAHSLNLSAHQGRHSSASSFFLFRFGTEAGWI